MAPHKTDLVIDQVSWNRSFIFNNFLFFFLKRKSKQKTILLTGTRQTIDNIQTGWCYKIATEAEAKSSLSNTGSGLNYRPQRSETWSEFIDAHRLPSSQGQSP